jgi:alpha-tubulin suppressor-like RCC1 family protein
MMTKQISTRTRLLGLGDNNYGQLFVSSITVPTDTTSSQPVLLGIDSISKPNIFTKSTCDWITTLVDETPELITRNEQYLNYDYCTKHDIVAISCGSLHTLLLTSTGSVYSFGG